MLEEHGSGHAHLQYQVDRALKSPILPSVFYKDSFTLTLVKIHCRRPTLHSQTRSEPF